MIVDGGTTTEATATIELGADGIVVARIYPGVKQTVADAHGNLAGAVRAAGSRRRPILVDISGCEPLTHEVRRCYTGETLTQSFTAVAMLVEATAFGEMIGNIYLRIAKLGIPARLFRDEPAARRWLGKHLHGY